jgi:hypothetical protein
VPVMSTSSLAHHGSEANMRTPLVTTVSILFSFDAFAWAVGVGSHAVLRVRSQQVALVLTRACHTCTIGRVGPE